MFVVLPTSIYSIVIILCSHGNQCNNCNISNCIPRQFQPTRLEKQHFLNYLQLVAMKLVNINHGKKCAEAPIQPPILVITPKMAKIDKSKQLTFTLCVTSKNVNSAMYELTISYFWTRTDKNDQ